MANLAKINTRLQNLSKRFINTAFFEITLSKSTPFNGTRTQDGDLQIYKSSRSFISWIFLAQYLIMGILYTLGLHARLQRGKNNMFFLGAHCIKLTGYWSAALIQRTLLKHPVGVVHLLNGSKAVHRWLQSHGFQVSDWRTNYLIMSPIISIYFVGYFIPPMAAGLGLFFPTDFGTVTGALRLVGIEMPSAVGYALCIYEVYLMKVYFLLFVFVMSVCWSYYVSALSWVRVFEKQTFTRSQTEDFQHLQNCHMGYNHLRCLTSVFNQVNWGLFSSMTIFLGALQTFNLFVVLRLYSKMPLQVYGVFVLSTVIVGFIIVVIFSDLGLAKHKAVLIIRRWRQQLHRNSLRSQANDAQIKVLLAKNRSCKSFGIRLFDIYFTLKTPARIIEAVLSFLILSLQLSHF